MHLLRGVYAGTIRVVSTIPVHVLPTSPLKKPETNNNQIEIPTVEQKKKKSVSGEREQPVFYIIIIIIIEAVRFFIIELRGGESEDGDGSGILWEGGFSMLACPSRAYRIILSYRTMIPTAWAVPTWPVEKWSSGRRYQRFT